MKKNGAPVLLVLTLAFATACASVPPPPPNSEPLTPTQKNTIKSTARGSMIGWLIGAAAGIAAVADGADVDAIADMADAGEAIGAITGAAHGARIGREFDREEDELLSIEGVDVFRADGDVLEIFATDDAMPDVAKDLAKYERDVEIRATSREHAREIRALLIASGVDEGDIEIRIDPLGPELMLRVD